MLIHYPVILRKVLELKNSIHLSSVHDVPGGVLLAVVLVKSCLATELVLLCVEIGPKSSVLERRESPCESC